MTTEVDAAMSSKRAEEDLQQAEEVRIKAQSGPELLTRIAAKITEVREEGLIQILDGLFDHVMETGLEYYVKHSLLLTPNNEDMSLGIAGKELPFTIAPELVSVWAPGSDMRGNQPMEVIPDETLLVTQDEVQESNSQSVSSPDMSMSSMSRTQEQEDSEEEEEEKEEPPKTPILPTKGVVNEVDMWLGMEISELNMKEFIDKFRSGSKLRTALKGEKPIEVPLGIQTVRLPPSYVVEGLGAGYILAVHPFPLVPGQLFLFTADYTDEDGNWLVRDPSLMSNWIRLISVSPQKLVQTRNSPKLSQTEYITVSGPSIIHANRGFTSQFVSFSLQNPRLSSIIVDRVKVSIAHILSTQDWTVWHDLVSKTNAIGFYQWLPYGSRHYHPLTVGCMSVLIPPFEGISGPIPLLRLIEIEDPEGDMVQLTQLPFDHVLHKVSPSATGTDLLSVFLKCMETLDLAHKSLGKAYGRQRSFPDPDRSMAAGDSVVPSDRH